MGPHVRQRLNEILGVHGCVKSLQLLESGGQQGRLILATMENEACAVSAQASLGLQSFGFNSLLINERWLQQHLGKS